MFPSFLSTRAARIGVSLTFVIATSLAGTQGAWALGQKQYVQFSPTPGSFTVVNANTTAKIYLDANDWPGVLRAANDLSNDIRDITGKTPNVISDAKPEGRSVILIGTLGKSRIIDRLVESHKIDVSAIQGK